MSYRRHTANIKGGHILVASQEELEFRYSSVRNAVSEQIQLLEIAICHKEVTNLIHITVVEIGI